MASSSSAAIIFMLLSAAVPADDHADALTAIDSRQYRRAMELLLPLAESGHPDAMFRVGMMYENGLGVPRDPQQAEEWYNQVCPTK